MENTNLNSYQSIPCQKCGRLVNNVGEKAIKVTCSYCVLSLVGLPKDSPNKIDKFRDVRGYVGKYIKKDRSFGDTFVPVGKNK